MIKISVTKQSADSVLYVCVCVFHQATLCSMKGCMRAMVAQLKSDSEDLQQVNLPVQSVKFLSHPVEGSCLLLKCLGAPVEISKFCHKDNMEVLY